MTGMSPSTNSRQEVISNNWGPGAASRTTDTTRGEWCISIPQSQLPNARQVNPQAAGGRDIWVNHGNVRLGGKDVKLGAFQK